MAATQVEIADGVIGWLDDVALEGAAIWVMTSDGLRAFGHPELVLPVRAHPQIDRAATASTLAQVLGAVARAAQQGQRVAAGGTTRFGGPVLGFDGVCYVPSAPIGAQHIPNSSLVGLFASAEELAGVEQFGARRFASRLARQTRQFPYPTWTDVARPRIANGPSVLADMPRVGVPGATITQESGALQLRLSRGTAGAMLSRVLPQLPRDVPPTLALHGVAASADACLVWDANQQAPEAVAPPGSRGERLGGCFLATANQQPENRSQIVEDGFAYFLRDADFARLRAALEAQQDLAIHGTRGDDLIVSWHDDAPPPPLAAGRVRLVSIQLLAEPKLAAKLVAAYAQALVAAVDRVLPPATAPYEMMIEVRPRTSIKLATRPASPGQDILQRCLDELARVPSPGELAFQAHLAIR